ncbi:MAG: DNA-directed RNA polymerase subunit alpha C-terminal domain-containing protein [Planctomycetota bacterium]
MTTASTADETAFDLFGTANPSFALLQQGRIRILSTPRERSSFESMLNGKSDSGDEGLRKGLGMWVVSNYEKCVALLASHAGNDVADFTRARALMALGRPEEALPLFERLSKAHPGAARPLGGRYEAELEIAVAKDPEADVAKIVDAMLAAAPDEFADSAEGRYLQGRRAEYVRDPETAIDHYLAAREKDATLRGNLYRAAYLADRCGLDRLALECYQMAVQLKIADRPMMLNYGVLLEDAGRDQEAASLYDMVARLDPRDERARLYLADAKSAMEMYYDEDLERKEDKLNQILRIPITDFELSVRARNCLSKMQIHTLGDLVCRTEQELLSYKNFGETSLNEIKEILRSKALRLGMPREEAVASIESRSRRPVGEDSDVRNRSITDLQLSIRARRTVESLGCLTLGDIVKHSADELLGMPNFGNTSLQELRSKLQEHGLKLAGE